MLLVVGIVVVVLVVVAAIALRNRREAQPAGVPVRRSKAYDVGGREGRGAATPRFEAKEAVVEVVADVAVAPEEPVVPEVVVAPDGTVAPNIVARNGVVVPGVPAAADAVVASGGAGVRTASQPATADEPARAPAAAKPAAVRWPERIDPRSGPLPDDARLRMLQDLGLLRAGWCVPILAQAYAEETEPVLRRAALTALANLRRPEARATLESAAAGADTDERAIAQIGLDGLNDAPSSP